MLRLSELIGTGFRLSKLYQNISRVISRSGELTELEQIREHGPKEKL